MKAPPPDAPQAGRCEENAVTARSAGKASEPALSQQGSGRFGWHGHHRQRPLGGGGSNSAQAVTGQDGVATDALSRARIRRMPDRLQTHRRKSHGQRRSRPPM